MFKVIIFYGAEDHGSLAIKPKFVTIYSTNYLHQKTCDRILVVCDWNCLRLLDIRNQTEPEYHDLKMKPKEHFLQAAIWQIQFFPFWENMITGLWEICGVGKSWMTRLSRNIRVVLKSLIWHHPPPSFLVPWYEVRSKNMLFFGILWGRRLMVSHIFPLEKYNKFASN